MPSRSTVSSLAGRKRHPDGSYWPQGRPGGDVFCDFRAKDADLLHRLHRWRRARQEKRIAREAAAQWHDRFQEVETFAATMCTNRTGSTLLGVILTAHPDVVMANTRDVLRDVHYGFDRDEIFASILLRDKEWIDMDWQFHDFDYRVPTGWQAKVRRLRVIGDKSGSLQWLRRDPAFFDRLEAIVGVPVRVLQTIRNPYDSIATMHLKAGETMEEAVERFFILSETAEGVRRRMGEDRILTVRHEEMIQDARTVLQEVAAFLGVSAEEEWLGPAAEKVFTRPSRSRDKVEWAPELVAEIEERLAGLSHLNGYRFDA